MAFPIAYFSGIAPEMIEKVINDLIQDINSTFQAMGFINPYSVTRRQFFAAIANLGMMNQVVQNISADTNNSTYLEFVSAMFVTPNDVLAASVQTTLGYTAAQMDALFVSAASYPP